MKSEVEYNQLNQTFKGEGDSLSQPIESWVEKGAIENLDLGSPDPPEWFRSAVSAVTDAWFDPKSFEQHPGFYERLGIRMFKKYVPTSGDLVYKLVWKRLNNRDRVKRDIDCLQDTEYATRIIEASHLLMIPLSIGEIAYFGGKYGTAVVPLGIALNIFGNIYPIMLQRYNRLRLLRAIKNSGKANQHYASNPTD